MREREDSEEEVRMLLPFKENETTRWVKTVRPGTDIGCGFQTEGWKFRCRRCGVVFLPVLPMDTRDVKIRARGDEKWARDNAIRAVWREGILSERAIAKAFGVSRSTVWRAVRPLGLGPESVIKVSGPAGAVGRRSF